MAQNGIPLVKQIGRVLSATVPLSGQDEKRYQGLLEETIMVDVHQHPFVFPEDLDQFTEVDPVFRTDSQVRIPLLK